MFRSTWVVLATALTIALTGLSPAQAEGADPPTQEEKSLIAKADKQGPLRVIVHLKEKADQQPVLTALHDEKVLRRYENFPLLALQVDSEGLAKLAESGQVERIQEDPIGDPGLASTIPLIGADRAHARGFNGTGLAVAVLDTGIDRDHPFFGNRLVEEACYSNPQDTNNQQSLCPNGQTTQTGAGSADAETARCVNGTNNLCSHGTHVAGIAAGGTGVAGAPGPGVAPAANIIAIQIFVRFNSGCPGGNNPCVRYFGSDLLAGLDRVFALRNNHTIAAANMSVYEGGVQTGACDNDNRKPAVDRLLSAGIASVMIAGNESDNPGVRVPSCISTAVTVGNSQDDDTVAASSGRGPLLDLFAPGTGVDSSVPDDGWDNFSGTSMAAPHVAGSFAVLRQAFPNEGVNQLLNRLRTTGVNITYTTGGNQVTTPRINLGAALPPNQAPGLTVDNATVTVDEGEQAVNAGNATDPEGGPLTLTASVGTVTRSGDRWNWAYTPTDNGQQTVTITATDNAGDSSSVSFTLVVRNKPPQVSIDPAQDKEIDEGDELTARANFTDAPGDGPFTGRIDWGFGAPDPGTIGNGTLTGKRRYGDNGSFDVTMSVTDKDGGTGSAAFPLAVKNVNPTAAIDESAATPVNGTPTFIGPRNTQLDFKARSTDPGSDDLKITWDWDDGQQTVNTHLVNPPNQDPLPSPSVQPRDVTDARRHAWSQPCLYDVRLASADDDAGSASDATKLIVTGDAHHRALTLYWITQYRPGPRTPLDLPVRTLDCYLEIVQYVSKVFSEARDVSTRDKAWKTLKGLSLDPKDRLDSELLTAWLNFAHGAPDYAELVDTNFDLRPETKFADAVAAAEAVRLDPDASTHDVLKQIKILEWINLGH